jgi:tryptophan halogenase
LSRVVVVGRDVDLWLCVNALCAALGPVGVQVVAIELPTGLKPSDVSATLPPLEALHTKLNIQESSLLRLTGGSFSLGHNIVAVSGRRGVPNFFHAWGAYGAPIDGHAFFPCWLKAARNGFNLPLQDFCLTAVAARNGRMLLPDEATAAFGRTDYGYHLPTMAYVSYLKSNAAKLGCKLHEVQSVSVECDAGGSIAALIADGSLRVESQLFVDASGAEALLIGRSLGVPENSWRAHFSVNRVLSAQAPAFTATPPFAEIRPTGVGWTALHPNRVATGVVHAYCGNLLSDAAAVELATTVSGTKLADVACRPVNPHVRARVWEGNCVAVGRSACSLDPIHNVDLHALQLGVVHLLALFPVSGQFTAERTEYNRIMHSHYERIRDFQCAFYALAPFSGEFWQQARDQPVPRPLAHKIALFRARGEIAPMEDETFFAESWQALLVGLGVTPESGSPVTERDRAASEGIPSGESAKESPAGAIDRISLSRLNDEFRRILEFIKSKVLEQPTHDRYLDSVCRS